MWTRLAWPSDPSVLRRNHAIILDGGLRPPSSFEGGLRPPFPSVGGSGPPTYHPPTGYAARIAVGTTGPLLTPIRVVSDAPDLVALVSRVRVHAPSALIGT